MTLSDITDIAVAGLVAQRVRMATTASNLANARTTKTAEGGPYRRRDPVFEAAPLKSGFGDRLDRHVRTVRVTRIVTDARDPIPRFDPSHPDADAEGNVSLPRVDPVEELTNAISARRSFSANLLALGKAREMSQAALQIGR